MGPKADNIYTIGMGPLHGRVARVNEKETKETKGVAPDATKPPTTPQDLTKDKEAPKIEIVLASLPLPAKGNPKGTDQGSSEAALQ